MIPDDVADIEAIAQQVELTAHRAGWDRPPVLGYFQGADEDDFYSSRPMPIDITRLHPHAGRAVAIMVEVFRARRDREAVASAIFAPEVRNRLGGVWLVHEAWMNDTPEGLRGDGRALADIPGSVEVRMVHLIDCGGRQVHVMRRRGQQPLTSVSQPGEVNEEVFRGPVIEVLRDLLLELCVFLPEQGYALEAIKAVGQ